MDFFRDIVLTAAVQSGGAAAGGSLGPELLTNGDMSSSTGWTLDPVGGVATIAGGKLTLSDDSFDIGPSALQTPALDNGATYRAAYTVDSITSDGVVVIVSGVTGTLRTAAGTYTEDFVSDGTDTFRLLANQGIDVVIDNASLKRVL